MDPTIASILNRLPKMRRTGIFSATTTFTHNNSVKPLLQRAGMRNPVLVNVQVAAATAAAAQEAVAESKSQASGNKNASSSSDSSKSSASPVAASTSSGYTPTSLTNYYMLTKLEEKMSRFVAFLQSHRDQKMIVFFLTCACVDFYGNVLQKILSSEDEANNSHTKKTKKKKQEDWQHEDFKPVQIEILHGKLVQKRREKAMERFRGMTGGALFCTDVAGTFNR
jgi:ATP-dependent RNA helicase DDX55/SPB4